MILNKEDKEKIAKWEALYRISQSTDYIEYLKPILQEAFNNKWPDPTQAKTPEEFHKQYTEQYGKAMAYKELYNLIESSGSVSRTLTSQIKNKKKGYGLS